MTIASLSPPATGFGRLIRHAVSWWLGELAEMLPRRFVGLLGGSEEPDAVLKIGAGDAILWSSEAALQSAIRSGRRGDAVTIGLDRTLIFETGIDLPLSAERSLRQILQHQIERLVPLDAAETRFEYRVERRAVDGKTMIVRVFIAKLATIERALSVARGAGLIPKLIVVADWQGEGAPPVLWRAGRPADTDRSLRRWLEIGAVVLAAVAYGLYVHRLDQVRDGLEARLAAATPAAAAVRSLGEEVGRIDAAGAFFERRRGEASPLRVVDALTKLVPTDSWVTRLEVRGRVVEIAGYAPRASDLVSRVESSALFEKPQFRSPITLAPDSKSERFDLTFEIRPGQAP
jgi:general secretion pathway protein L